VPILGYNYGVNDRELLDRIYELAFETDRRTRRIEFFLRERAPQIARIDFALPTITRNGDIVPNIQLANDTVETITIVTTDAAGATVPAPAGDTFTVVSSNPASLGAAIGTDKNGAPAVVLTPLVQVSPGLTFTVTDSAGLASDAQGVDIVADLAPKTISLDIADATTAPQAVPTAPGP